MSKNIFEDSYLKNVPQDKATPLSYRDQTCAGPDYSVSMNVFNNSVLNDQPAQSDVIRYGLQAIKKNKEHMSAEQIRNAYTQLKLGTCPDNSSQLVDRLDSYSFQ